jgi:putative chitinase
MIITSSLLRKLCPSGKQDIIDGVALYLNQYAKDYDLINDLRMCHFLAQAAHESAHFMTLEEYASGLAYERRADLGNTQPGDGVRYKGRGIFQLTGRANYITYGKKLGLDLVNHPDLASTPEVSVRVALEYWKDKNLNALADADDIVSITRRINGGTNGLDERKAYLAKITKLIQNPDALYKGDHGEDVRIAQTLLVKKGYKIIADGDFGNNTQYAVREYQRDHNIIMSGIIDKETLASLRS